MRPFTTVMEAVIAVGVAALLIFFGFDNVRLSVQLAQAVNQYERTLAMVSAQRADFEAQARQREREQHEALAAIRTLFDEELSDAQAKHDAVVAGLAADTVRLRRHWRGCVATAELSATAAAAARADADTELRNADSGALVRAGAECDARIRALQAIVTSQQGVP